MRYTAPAVFAIAVLAPLPLVAQSVLEPVRADPSGARRIQAKVTPSCTDGLVTDDGTVENGLAFAGPPDGPPTVDLVTRLDAGAGARMEQVCICWTRLGTQVDTLDFDIVFYDTSGPGGAPGVLLARVPVTASGIPRFAATEFFDFDVSALGIQTPTSGVYVGTSWQSYTADGPDPRFFVCTDEDGPGGQAIFATDNPAAGWTDVGVLEEDAQLPTRTQSLFVRAEVTGGASEPCVESETTLCLGNARFGVEIGWRSATGQGVGMAERLTDDTGYFWFFNRENVEMVIKVLSGCDINDHFWVFAGGLTDVEVDITVTDTATGAVETYRNPASLPFQPIQDVEAFATCP